VALGRKGGLVVLGGIGGGAEKEEIVVSSLRIASNEAGDSQGGGMILALRCRLRSRASHRGRVVRCGGCRGAMGPWRTSIPRRLCRWVLSSRGSQTIYIRVAGHAQGASRQLTPSNSSPSSRCRGTMVTVSISQRKATSGGVRPVGKGSAIVAVQRLSL